MYYRIVLYIACIVQLLVLFIVLFIFVYCIVYIFIVRDEHFTYLSNRTIGQLTLRNPQSA